MKKIFVCFLVIVVVMIAGTAIAAAGSTQVDAVTSATPATAATAQPTSAPAPTTTGSAVTADSGADVAIPPDSVLYPIKKMIESVQVTLAFTPEGKAELLVAFANERLAEANLMTEKNKVQLVQKVMEAYVDTINEAVDRTEEAAHTQKDMKPLLESIQITEQTADNFVIKAVGMIPADAAEQLKATVTKNVKITIASQAAAEAKNQYKAAIDQVKQARENLKLANKVGNDTMVKTANAELLKAQQAKEKAEQLKKQAKALEKQIHNSLKQDKRNKSKLDKQDDEDDDRQKIDEQDDKEQDDKEHNDKEYNDKEYNEEND